MSEKEKMQKEELEQVAGGRRKEKTVEKKHVCCKCGKKWSTKNPNEYLVYRYRTDVYVPEYCFDCFKTVLSQKSENPYFAKFVKGKQLEKVSGGVDEGQYDEYIKEMEEALKSQGVLCERCGRLFLPITKDSKDEPPKICPYCSCSEE